MDGYKRMKNVSTERSRSVDFSDISFKSHTPRKPISNTSIPPPDSTNKIPEKAEGSESEESAGEIFGVILNKKSASVSSSSSRNYLCPCIADEHQKEGEGGAAAAASVQSALKRVFSMKRSSSVSEGYSRIHHQSDPIDHEDGGTRKRSSKKKGKILATFRRVFGF